MNRWIKPSELLIAPKYPTPAEVQDKMLIYHIDPVNPIREVLNVPIWASSNSGFRPKEYEIEKGREPDGVRRLHWSRHTYEPCPGDPEGKGATDWTTLKQYLERFASLLIERTDYHRLALYRWGIHGDYKKVTDERQLIIADGWTPVNERKFFETITDYAGEQV